jgi:hypothetical protein
MEAFDEEDSSFFVYCWVTVTSTILVLALCAVHGRGGLSHRIIIWNVVG